MTSSGSSGRFPKWHRTLLKAAAVYNLVWGAVAIAFPMLLFKLVGMDPLPNYPELWQCIGMIVGVYGIGYWIAASDPVRHWPIVLVGLLGKIFGPIGFVQAVLADRFPLAMGLTILTNDLIWWVPFSLILLNAKHQEFADATGVEESPGLPPNTLLRRDSAQRSKIVYSSLQGAVSDN
jgi:MFS family permease